MPGTQLSIVILSATVSCFIVLILTLIIIILKYRKKEPASSQASQTVKLHPWSPGHKKPYSERVVQYLLGYSDGSEGIADDETRGSNSAWLTRPVHVQPSSESDYEWPDPAKPRRSSLGHDSSAESQIDTDMYRARSYTDTASPEGKSGIWRARESLFFKRGKIRKESENEGESTTDCNRSPPTYKSKRDKASTQPIHRKSPSRVGKAQLLFDEAFKVTGKPPLSPKTVSSATNTPQKTNVFQPKVGQPRRHSTTMVHEKLRAQSPSQFGFDNLWMKQSPGSLVSLTANLGSLEISLCYNSEERLLKVCVLDVKNTEEDRSLVDSYVKVAFYLFEKPYKNEMQLWSNSTKSLVKRTFTYLVRNVSDLQRATLRFTIRRKNNIVKNKILGRAILRLCGMDVQPAETLCTLKLEHSITELHGELLVSVCHQAIAGILRVGIIRAMGLAKTMRKTMGAPFVIVEMSSACKVFYVKNTKQKSNKIHPLFDENFDIPISTDSKVTLDDFRLKITVFRYTFSGSNDIIGLVLLGSGTSSLHEAAHWKEVTHNPHKTVMKWHKLRIG